MMQKKEKIYLDNASTTFPKPETVPLAMADFIRHQGVNINRGTYSTAYETEELVFETREQLCRLFGSTKGPLKARGPHSHLLHGAQRRHASPGTACPA